VTERSIALAWPTRPCENCQRGDSGSRSDTSVSRIAGIVPIQNIARQLPDPANARFTRYAASSPITISSWLSVSIRPRI
jgi:hypothetical protein